MIENESFSSMKLSVSMATKIFFFEHNFVIFPFKIARFYTKNVSNGTATHQGKQFYQTVRSMSGGI